MAVVSDWAGFLLPLALAGSRSYQADQLLALVKTMSQTSYSPTDSSDSDADIPSASASTHSGSDDDEEDDAEFEDAQEYSHPHTHPPTHTHTHTSVQKADESQSQSQSQMQDLSTHMTSTTQDTPVTSQSQAQAGSIPSSSRVDSSTTSTASMSQSPSPPLSRPVSVTASPSPSPSPSTSTSTTPNPTHDLPAPLTTSSAFTSRSISDPTSTASPSKSDIIIDQHETHDTNNTSNNNNNSSNNNDNNTSNNNNNNTIPQPLQTSFKDSSRSISVPTSVGPTGNRNTSMSGSYGSTHPPGAEGVFIVKNLDTGEVCDLDEAEIMFPEVRRVHTVLDLKTFDEATAARQPHTETEAPDKDPDMKSKKETLGFFNKMRQVFGGTTGTLKGDRASNQVKVKTHHKPVQEFNDVRLVQVIYPHNGPIWALSYNHDGAFLATGGQDSIVRVFATHNTIAAKELADAKLDQVNDESPELPKGVGRRVISPTPFRTYAGHKSDVIDLAWSKANFLLSASIDKTVRLWHVSRVQCLCLFQHTDFVTSVSFHPIEDRYFLSGSFDKKLRIWNIPEHRVVEWAQTPQIITACSFAPDGNKAAAGLYNGQVVFYQTRGLKYFTQIECKNRHGKYRKGKKVTGLQFAPDGKHLLITTNDSRVRLYDMDDYSMVAKFKGLSNDELQIRASFNADGRYIISGSEDESVYVWNVHQHTTPPQPALTPSTSTSTSTNTTESKSNGTHTTPPTQVHTLPTTVNNTPAPSTTAGVDPLAALLAALGGQSLPTPSPASTISGTSASASDPTNGHPHLTVPTTSTTIAPPSPSPSPSASPPSSLSTSNTTSNKHELEKNDSYEYFKACSHTVTCAKFTPTNTILLSLGLVADVPTSQPTDESSHSPPQHTTPSGHSDTLTPPITPSHHIHARNNSNSVPAVQTPGAAVAGAAASAAAMVASSTSNTATSATLAQASSMGVDHIIVAAGYNGELKFFHAKR